MLNTFTKEKGKQQVLVVDDDIDFADSVSDILEGKGFSVIVVDNFQEAKTAVCSCNPDLALIDVRLGQMNGIDLIIALQHLKQDLLCVMMTAHTSEEFAISALRNGAYDYLRKPFDINRFFSVVDRCFDRIDIEQQREIAEIELKKSEARYQQFYHETPAMFFTVSKKGVVLSVNKYGAEYLGYTTDEIQQQQFSDLYSEESAKEIQCHIKQLFFEQKILLNWEQKKQCKDGSTIWVRETARICQDSKNESVALIVSEDITETKNLANQLSYQATHDPLTNLINRSYFEKLVAQDTACYLAKDNGRNRVYLYQHDDLESGQHIGEMHWVTRIQAAIDQRRLIAYAQPVVDIRRQNQVYSYELLVRMIDIDGEIILPGAFLPAAERYNLITKIDRIMICHAIDIQSKMRNSGQKLTKLAINLSGQSLCDQSILDYIIDSIKSGDLEAESICFEITETQAIQNLKRAVNFMQQLNQFGCCFYLDDFGTGLSSFAYLNALSVTSVKIDGVFVKDISSNKMHQAMVKSIHDISHTMGKETIAEYVTKQETVDILKEIGVDFAQGYLFGLPKSTYELFK